MEWTFSLIRLLSEEILYKSPLSFKTKSDHNHYNKYYSILHTYFLHNCVFYTRAKVFLFYSLNWKYAERYVNLLQQANVATNYCDIVFVMSLLCQKERVSAVDHGQGGGKGPISIHWYPSDVKALGKKLFFALFSREWNLSCDTYIFCFGPHIRKIWVLLSEVIFFYVFSSGFLVFVYVFSAIIKFP